MVKNAPSRIVRIDGHELRCQLPEVIGNSSRFFDQRSALLVSVTAADGTVGWGETWAMPAAAAAAIRNGLGQAVLGQDSATPRGVWEAMVRTLGYDRRGVSHMAMSAIDIAVWDAAARRARVPIAALLGGALRDRVPAYVSGPFLKPGADPLGWIFTILIGIGGAAIGSYLYPGHGWMTWAVAIIAAVALLFLFELVRKKSPK